MNIHACARRVFASLLFALTVIVFSANLAPAEPAENDPDTPGWLDDLTWGNQARYLAVYRDTLFAGGAASKKDGNPAIFPVARFDGEGWRACPGWTGPAAFEIGRVGDMIVHEETLVVSGSEGSGRGPQDPGLFVYDGRWKRFPRPPAFDSWYISDLESYGDRLVACGRFKDQDEETCRNVLAWNGQDWQSLGLNLGWKQVPRLCLHEGNLILASSMRSSQMDDRYLYREIFQYEIHRFDGSQWSLLRMGRGGLLGDLVSHQGKLYVGFGLLAEETDLAPVMVLDGNDWRQAGSPLMKRAGGRTFIRALAVHDRFLVAAGSFDSCDGHRCLNVAFLHQDVWKPVGPGVPGFMIDNLFSCHQTLWCGGDLVRFEGPIPLDLPLVPVPGPPPVARVEPPGPKAAAGPFRNGDFTDWRDGAPTGWEIPRGPWGIIHKDLPPPRLSDHVTVLAAGGLVFGAGPDSGISRPTLSQKCDISAGKYYRLRALCRSVSPDGPVSASEGRLQLNLGGLWDRLPVEPGEMTWHEITLLAGERARTAKISFSLNDDRGSVEIRRVEFEEVDLSFVDSFDLLCEELAVHYSGVFPSTVRWDSLTSVYRPIARDAVNIEAFRNILHEYLRHLEDARICLERSVSDVTEISRTFGKPEERRFRPVEEISPRDIHERFPELASADGCPWTLVDPDIVYMMIQSPWVEKTDLEVLPELERAGGLVLDLRFYFDRSPGNQSTRAQRWGQTLAGRFAAANLAYGLSFTRGLVDPRGAVRDTLRVEKTGERLEPLPVACLIGPRSRGLGAELALICKALPNATLIGRPTAGGPTYLHEVHLPAGLKVHFPTCAVHFLDGTSLDEGRGVEPDLLVEYSDDGDPALEKGLEFLRDRMSGND